MSSSPSTPRHQFSRASAIFLGLLVMGALAVFTLPDSAELVTVSMIVFGNLATGTLIIRKAQRMQDRERVAWVLIGAAFATSAIGVLAGAVTAAIVGSIPAFSGFDFVILTGYALIIAGIGALPGGGGDWRERAQRVIDGIVASLAIATLTSTLFLEEIFVNLSDAPLFDRWVGSAYPILDVAALVSMGIVFVRRRQYRFDPRLALLALGLAIQAVADLSFLRTGTGVSLDEAMPNFGAFASAAVLYFATASIAERQPATREVSDRHTPIWSLIAPYGAALGLFGFLTLQIFNDAAGRTALLFGASLTVTVLVFVRQALAIRENRMIVERERNSLISSLSHELRTPLTSLVGFLSVLDDDGDLLTASERIEIISTTRQQADFMGRMVTDLVMLARDDLDQVDIVPSAEMLGDVVERSLVSADIPRDQLTVDVRRDLVVSVDRDRIQQVLVNLLTNAERYGSGRITITAVVQRRDLFLSVHDNGAGIPKKHHVTMWDRFERAHHRYDASIPGSGIGLAIVASLVKAHGGRVGYRTSELLGGACFTVELPGAVVPSEAATLAETVFGEPKETDDEVVIRR